MAKGAQEIKPPVSARVSSLKTSKRRASASVYTMHWAVIDPWFQRRARVGEAQNGDLQLFVQQIRLPRSGVVLPHKAASRRHLPTTL